ncbi:MAG: UDP-N-acetylglucosamine 1-carboxyvinyltransferase [Parcubacteria group bacterium]|nr:UDP-N-acetylglucosamine 1-carboxyvinyltransferase [Parcubacteria group bacterium]
MSTFVIRGGRQLSGTWRVQGMKNAATPVLAATLLTSEECTIHNIPRIRDLEHMLAILEDLGARIRWNDEHTLTIQTKEIAAGNMDYLLTKRMRSSVLFMGPLLARLGQVTMPEPGGCNIGNRPLTAHFEALKGLGASVKKDGAYYTISGRQLQAGNIAMVERSVTATENALMAAAGVPGATTITNAASEPHVVCLANFLRAMGAHIEGVGTTEIRVRGTDTLRGVDFTIIPDQLEIGTVAVLGALAASELTIAPVVSEDMAVVAEKLRQAGVELNERGNSWIVSHSPKALRAFTLETAPHPGFPTDLQAPFGVLATQAQGISTIHDPMYENRLGYLEELSSMGARAEILDAHTARITGPMSLSGAEINSLDLRAGATLIIAGLVASGETVLHDAEIIDRGYEAIDERLRAIGADITRVE